MKKILTILVFLSQIYSSQWRWANDTMLPTDDKQVHAVGSFGLYYMLVHKDVKPNKAVIIVSILGLTKECLDAYFPWETYGRMGGDGFSKNDIAYNLIGLTFAYTTDNCKIYKINYKSNEIIISYLF